MKKNQTQQPSKRFSVELVWEEESRTLYLSGAGRLPLFGAGQAPWEAYRSDVETLVVQEGILNLSANAFSNCPNLMTVRLPESLTFLGGRAFAQCPRLETVSSPLEGFHSLYAPGSEEESGVRFGHHAFFQTPFANARWGTELLVKDCYVEYLGSAPQVAIPEGIQSIAPFAFEGCETLEKISFPDTLVEIGVSAFQHTGLRQVELPKSVKTVGGSAFADCPRLLDIQFNSTQVQFNHSTFSHTLAEEQLLGDEDDLSPAERQLERTKLWNRLKSRPLYGPVVTRQENMEPFRRISVQKLHHVGFPSCSDLDSFLLRKIKKGFPVFRLTASPKQKVISVEFYYWQGWGDAIDTEVRDFYLEKDGYLYEKTPSGGSFLSDSYLGYDGLFPELDTPDRICQWYQYKTNSYVPAGQLADLWLKANLDLFLK